jgi:hypothetical protein
MTKPKTYRYSALVKIDWLAHTIPDGKGPTTPRPPETHRVFMSFKSRYLAEIRASMEALTHIRRKGGKAYNKWAVDDLQFLSLKELR